MVENARFGKIGNWWTSLEKIRTSPTTGAESLYVYEWAERPVILSEGFYSDQYPESSKFTDGPTIIHNLLCGLDSMFLHEFTDLNREYLSENGFRAHLFDRLKDPGLLHHFVFWDFNKDRTAVTFEWHHYHGESKICLEMLHGQNYDIYGRPCLANAIRLPWNHLQDLYHDELKCHRSAYAQKLFNEVIGWPLS